MTDLLLNSSYSNLESNRCVPSAVPGFRHIICLIKYVDTAEVFCAMSCAISSARGRTFVGSARTSEKRSARRGDVAGYVEPVVVR